MKILIPVFNFTSSGGSRVLSQFANYWIKSGHKVTFLCRDYSDQPYFPTEARVVLYNKNGNIVSSFIDSWFNLKKISVVINQFAMKKAIETIGNEYDIIIANHSLTAFPVHRANINSRKFYYVQAYEPEYYESVGGFFNNILKYYSRATYRLDTLVKIVNSPIYYSYKEIKTSKFVFCGLDLDNYYPKSREQINMSKKTIKIGTVGRVEKHKGTSYVLEAFKILQLKNKSLRDYQLHIAFGDKSFEDTSNGIYVTTPNGDKNLADFYREMDIIVAAGTVQFGAVHYPVLESMACRTPVITTFYLPAHDANAWLCEPKSVDSIYEQILNVIHGNNTLEKTENALKDIQQFNWSIVSEKMIKIFAGK